MPIALPCAAVFVLLFCFGGIATCSANKNPQLTFFYLYAEKCYFLFAADGADFCFHL